MICDILFHNDWIIPRTLCCSSEFKYCIFFFWHTGIPGLWIQVLDAYWRCCLDTNSGHWKLLLTGLEQNQNPVSDDETHLDAVIGLI